MYKNVQDNVIQGLPLAISIFIRLREDILRGRLENNEKLTEQRICNEYNVSRTPVREAFRLLEQEGFLKMIPNKGAYVTGFTDQDISDMFEMRRVYEMLALEWAIDRVTPEEMEKISEAFELTEFYAMKHEYDKAAELNTKFHEMIYDASKNRMLTGILTSYQYYSKRLRPNVIRDQETIDALIDEHQAILNALKNKDKEAGVEAVSRHLAASKRRAGFE